MISPEGETVKYIKFTSTKSEIELWLYSMQENMIETLYRLMKQGMVDFENKERKLWVLAHIG